MILKGFLCLKKITEVFFSLNSFLRSENIISRLFATVPDSVFTGMALDTYLSMESSKKIFGNH